jgi:hypothetical protein
VILDALVNVVFISSLFSVQASANRVEPKDDMNIEAAFVG